jgi:hypothetical protein
MSLPLPLATITILRTVIRASLSHDPTDMTSYSKTVRNLSWVKFLTLQCYHYRTSPRIHLLHQSTLGIHHIPLLTPSKSYSKGLSFFLIWSTLSSFLRSRSNNFSLSQFSAASHSVFNTLATILGTLFNSYFHTASNHLSEMKI